VAHYEATVTSPKPIEEVFAYVANLANADEWDPSITRAETQASDPLSLGAQFDIEVDGPLGRRLEMTYKTVEIDRPHLAVVRAETGSLVSRDEIRFREQPGGGTEVTYSAELRPKGLLRLADPVLALGFQRYGSRARDGLEQRLNS
jgi:uncharacterized protein YndB with AHSA1/START domain